MSSPRQRRPNPTIQNFLPSTRYISVVKNSSNSSVNLNEMINNNRSIPRVSVKTTSQLCVTRNAKTFPYMRVSSDILSTHLLSLPSPSSKGEFMKFLPSFREINLGHFEE